MVQAAATALHTHSVQLRSCDCIAWELSRASYPDLLASKHHLKNTRCTLMLLCSGRVCQSQDWRSNHKFECPNLQKSAALAAISSSEQLVNGAVHKPPPPDPNEDAPVPQQVLFPYQHYLQLSHSRYSCRKPPVGFSNLGNNCYANAALQCLLANKPLRAYLDQGLHSSSCNKPSRQEWCLLCELQVS